MTLMFALIPTRLVLPQTQRGLLVSRVIRCADASGGEVSRLLIRIVPLKGMAQVQGAALFGKIIGTKTANTGAPVPGDSRAGPFLIPYRTAWRNALRAGLVKRAEQWKHSSLGQRALDAELRIPLSCWPITRRL